MRKYQGKLGKNKEKIMNATIQINDFTFIFNDLTI